MDDAIKKNGREYLSSILIVLKNKTIHSIFVNGEKGFPLEAICFPVGERRAVSSATAPFRGLPVSLYS
ncbi:hypothetical protein CRI88_00930 [Lysinibacillus fusiformis]|uniref:Uncharacterized protein n=1 Tax=Lysinibacillus fusiformis TaxID=28031 RepID=A0A2I0V3N1_9BACI|nr:hypothetical protein CRI88_00930 [Lysinibacillus fusiformis]